MMLDDNGLHHIPVNAVPGQLGDHYDPAHKTVNLSQSNYAVPSISAMALAAQEVGHAVQDKVRMPALVLRGRLAVPLTSAGIWLLCCCWRACSCNSQA